MFKGEYIFVLLKCFRISNKAILTTDLFCYILQITSSLFAFKSGEIQSVSKQKNAHLILNFLVAPMGKGGQKITWSIMYVKFWSQKIRNKMCDFLTKTVY